MNGASIAKEPESWKDLHAEEKIERMRIILKKIEQDHDNRINKIRKELELYKKHVHGQNGDLQVSIGKIKEYENEMDIPRTPRPYPRYDEPHDSDWF